MCTAALRGACALEAGTPRAAPRRTGGRSLGAERASGPVVAAWLLVFGLGPLVLGLVHWFVAFWLLAFGLGIWFLSWFESLIRRPSCGDIFGDRIDLVSRILISESP